MVFSFGKPEITLSWVLLAIKKPPPICVSEGNERLLRLGQSTKARVPPVIVMFGAEKLSKVLEYIPMEPAQDDREGISILLTFRKVKFAAPSRLGKLISRSLLLAENERALVTFFMSLTLMVVKKRLLLISMLPTAVNSMPESEVNCVSEM